MQPKSRIGDGSWWKREREGIHGSVGWDENGPLTHCPNSVSMLGSGEGTLLLLRSVGCRVGRGRAVPRTVGEAREAGFKLRGCRGLVPLWDASADAIC